MSALQSVWNLILELFEWLQRKTNWAERQRQCFVVIEFSAGRAIALRLINLCTNEEGQDVMDETPGAAWASPRT